MLRSLSATMSAILSAGALSLAGCSGDDSAAEPTIVASPTASAPADDPPGSVTCNLLAQGVRNATLMIPGTVAKVVTASSTADAPVADAARRLAAAYAAALAAKSQATEPDLIAAVSAAGAEMSAVCEASGLDTVG